MKEAIVMTPNSLFYQLLLAALVLLCLIIHAYRWGTYQEEYVWPPVCVTSIPSHGEVGSYPDGRL